MVERNSKGCTPTGCFLSIIVVSLIITFVFGNKELGKWVFDYGFKALGVMFLIGVLIFIYLDSKNK